MNTTQFASLFENQEKVYGLDDISTPFPRSNSLRGNITFENGQTFAFTTNLKKEEFHTHWIGKMVKDCFYDKDPEAKVLKIVDITFNG